MGYWALSYYSNGLNHWLPCTSWHNGKYVVHPEANGKRETTVPRTDPFNLSNARAGDKDPICFGH